jgi:putative PIN family toxin of toxin-antitoxin system
VLLLRSEIVIPLDCNKPELRDPKDLKVIGTLLAAGADFLVTGDKDLLALSHKYPILTPAAFWQRQGA